MVLCVRRVGAPRHIEQGVGTSTPGTVNRRDGRRRGTVVGLVSRGGGSVPLVAPPAPGRRAAGAPAPHVLSP